MLRLKWIWGPTNNPLSKWRVSNGQPPPDNPDHLWCPKLCFMKNFASGRSEFQAATSLTRRTNIEKLEIVIFKENQNKVDSSIDVLSGLRNQKTCSTFEEGLSTSLLFYERSSSHWIQFSKKFSFLSSYSRYPKMHIKYWDSTAKAEYNTGCFSWSLGGEVKKETPFPPLFYCTFKWGTLKNESVFWDQHRMIYPVERNTPSKYHTGSCHEIIVARGQIYQRLTVI